MAAAGTPSYVGAQQDLTQRQLAGLWVKAGGDPSMAPTMSAIAMAESAGNPTAYNPSGASGLWQILGKPFPGNAFDPLTNAKMAVAKYQSQGLGAWATYTNGSYQQFMGTAPTGPAAITHGGASSRPTSSAPAPAGKPPSEWLVLLLDAGLLLLGAGFAYTGGKRMIGAKPQPAKAL